MDIVFVCVDLIKIVVCVVYFECIESMNSKVIVVIIMEKSKMCYL